MYVWLFWVGSVANAQSMTWLGLLDARVVEESDDLRRRRAAKRDEAIAHLRQLEESAEGIAEGRLVREVLMRMYNLLYARGVAQQDVDALEEAHRGFTSIANVPSYARVDTALRGIGLSAMRLHRASEADAAWVRILDDHPESQFAGEALVALGDLRLDEEGWSKAQPYYRAAAARTHGLPARYGQYRMAWAHHHEGNQPAALAGLEAVGLSEGAVLPAVAGRELKTLGGRDLFSPPPCHTERDEAQHRWQTGVPSAPAAQDVFISCLVAAGSLAKAQLALAVMEIHCDKASDWTRRQPKSIRRAAKATLEASRSRIPWRGTAGLRCRKSPVRSLPRQGAMVIPTGQPIRWHGSCAR